MKKLSLLSLVACLAQSLSAQITDPAPYCSYNTWGAAPITRVEFGGDFDHEPVYDWATSMYNYYNALPPMEFVIDADAEITLKITFNAAIDFEPSFFSVYIDMNHDDVFSDDEDVMNNSTTGGGYLPSSEDEPQVRTGSFSLDPDDAMPGLTRMRIVRGHPIPIALPEPDAVVHVTNCNSGTDMEDTDYSYGAVVDYNVNLTLTDGSSITTNIKPTLEIYPNPASDYVQINGLTTEIIEKCSIYDMNGQWQKEVSLNNNSFSVADLATGIYILEIALETGEITRMKFSIT